MYRYRSVPVLLFSSMLAACGGGGGGSGGTDAPVVPFVASSSDLVLPSNPFTYTDGTVARFNLTYQLTTITGQDLANGYYTGADGDVCQPYDASVTYPVTLTLDDVNRDVDDTDLCVPEIKVNFQSPAEYENGAAYNAKMRMRGSSTRLADQKSYRVKLKSGVPLWRSELTLQLNKHPYDLARVRNKLAMDLMRDMPYVPSLRTQFVQMYYNDGTTDSDYGLFTHVEKFGKEFLVNRGLDSTAFNIYKAEDFYFTPSDQLALNADGTIGADFEKVLSVENAASTIARPHDTLIAMVNEISNESIDFNTTFNKYFNRNNYLMWLATNILMGNHDTLTQNFALLQPASTNKFYFMPWDYDGSLGFEDQPNEAAEGDLYDDWQLGVANWWESPLHRRFLQQPGNVRLLMAAVDEVRNTYLTTAKIQILLDGYRPLIEPLVTQAPDINRLPTYSGSSATGAQQWEDEFDRLPSVIETNYSRFVARLQNPMPYWQSAEVSGAQLVLAWDQAVDLQGNAVSYSVKIASTPDFSSGVVYSTTTTALQKTINKPASGTWYMKVVAADSAGHVTNAFDRTDIGDVRYFGVLAFTVP